MPNDSVALRSLAAVVGAECRGEAEVTGVCVDSRVCGPGQLFAAVVGERSDGHDHAAEAVARGATGLLVQRWLPLDVPQLRVPWTRGALGPLSAAAYGHPGRRLTLLGVTGTNGKTTTAHLARSALLAAGHACGLLGTVENRFGDWSEPSRLTTAEAPELQRLLARMTARGADSVVMEVSSQGLDQHRVDGIRYDVAVWLNLGTDHLDYHGTVEQYWAAKARLFTDELSRERVICVDSAWGRRLAHQVRERVTTFARTPGVAADVHVELVSSGLDGTQVVLHGAEEAVRLQAPVVGAVNADNVAAAYLAARRLGASPAQAAEGLRACSSIPGRFELVDAGQPFLVIVDYAHTPDAYGPLVATARRFTGPGGEVHLVVGCRGEKDRFKRPETGRVAVQADHPVFTTDSPGREDPRDIVAQMMAGVLALPHGHVRVILNRREAIHHAIATARRGDVILIAGRGHERTRRLRERAEQFDDRLVAAEALTVAGYAGTVEEVDSYPLRPTVQAAS